MSDLSNLLGDLYGDSRDPDGPPVRHEAPASDRGRADDDLAAALSAALADPPAAAPSPAPPVMPQVAQAPAPAPAPAPRPSWTAPAVAETAPAPAPVPVAAPVETPVAHVAAPAGPRMWMRGDDDITPMAGMSKKRK